MLVSIKTFDEDGSKKILPVSVLDISYLDFKDSKNIEAGTIIFLRSNTEIFTKEPMDIIHKKIQDTFERYASLVLVSAVSEAAKRVAKKPTRKKG